MRQVDAGAIQLLVEAPEAARVQQLRAQRPFERTRQHDDAVLAALAVAHDDHLAHEIDILDAQAHAFEQAHAGAIEEARQQARDALAHARQQRLHFHLREHDGDALLRDRPAELLQPRHVDAEHLAVEKEQGAQGLAVRGGGDAALVGQHHQIGLHLRRTEILRMAQPRPPDEAPHPVDVRLLRP